MWSPASGLLAISGTTRLAIPSELLRPDVAKSYVIQRTQTDVGQATTLLFQKKVVPVCHRMLQTALERLLIRTMLPNVSLSIARTYRSQEIEVTWPDIKRKGAGCFLRIEEPPAPWGE